jgi:hypothetical protein
VNPPNAGSLPLSTEFAFNSSALRHAPLRQGLQTNDALMLDWRIDKVALKLPVK